MFAITPTRGFIAVWPAGSQQLSTVCVGLLLQDTNRAQGDKRAQGPNGDQGTNRAQGSNRHREALTSGIYASLGGLGTCSLGCIHQGGLGWGLFVLRFAPRGVHVTLARYHAACSRKSIPSSYHSIFSVSCKQVRFV